MAMKKEVLKAMLLRAPQWNSNKLHYKAKIVMNQMSQPPKPLEFKLQELPENSSQFLKLGVQQALPFNIQRTETGNLPVYRKYRHGRMQQRTIIRKVEGDVDKFAEELQKVCSNAEVIKKVGRVEVKGLHKNSVHLWLQRLGF
ncbi:hypothetical protein PPERSA_00772 [Pseudocohnilembus persalinus]|uniref:Large ribosomal subunit protein mL49 n=1 Tax=Pseudocohnilembus persalinus TaxID=266149 RepID=A0A0V0Q9T6_PSEPJ|nr:hypothetical protein PPERSA_00772 [Pseudocohnilembus persalinus]|eukprot:KRW98945.1 hypothetical protein PPERSA_00772 [Pseudocohnilembus persalinus]